MIISTGRRYIFVHAPKTGGTALTLALEARAMKDDLLISDTPKAVRRRGRLKGLTPRGRLWKHSTLADIDGVVPLADLDGLRVFTLIRNPWDRLVSHYHWLRAQGFDHPQVTLAKTLPFPAFVAAPAVMAAFRASPARHYLTDAAGRERCDLFLRLEHLDQDLPRLESLLDLRLAPLPVANRSDRAADYRTYYDDATAALVGDICAEDIARFGYRF